MRRNSTFNQGIEDGINVSVIFTFVSKESDFYKHCYCYFVHINGNISKN